MDNSTYNCCQKVNKLKPEHLNEWVNGSGCDPELTRLNVQSLENDDAVYTFLCQSLPHSERLNGGRLSSRWLNRYKLPSEGGWLCSGIDIDTGLDDEWGCFKPDVPHPESEKNKWGEWVKTGKGIKYEHPVKTPTKAFFLKVPDHLWQKIGDRYGVAPYCSLDCKKSRENYYYQFWAWVKDNPTQLPVTITEGAKKAGALLSKGIIAIGLPGIFSGVRKDPDRLIPELIALGLQGREIIFCFDNDKKQKTQKNVRIALLKTSRLIKLSGGTTTVMMWGIFPEKGIDDLIVSRGENCLDDVFERRLTLDQYRIIKDLKVVPDIEVNQRYLEPINIPKGTKIVALKSFHDTGKTQFLSQFLEQYKKLGYNIIAPVPRISLAKNLGNRLGLDYRTELHPGSGVKSYSLVIDSLHPKANPPFNAYSYGVKTILILDEIEQTLQHLFNSPTCLEKRGIILESLIELIQNIANDPDSFIICSDADVSNISLDYIKGIMKYDAPTFIVQNNYKPCNGRKMFRCGSQDAILAIVKDYLEGQIEFGNGKKQPIFIGTDGQKSDSLFGTKNLECYLKKCFPNIEVLRVDAKTVKDSTHPAYNFCNNPNEVIPHYDVIICSPVIETGISITYQEIGAVFLMSSGVQRVRSVHQMLQRVRKKVPCYCYIKDYSTNRIGNGSDSPYSLAQSFKGIAKNTIRVLQSLAINEVSQISIIDNDPDTQGLNPSLRAYCRYAALQNYEAKRFADAFYEYAVELGFDIIDSQIEKDSGIRESIKESRDNLFNAYKQQLQNAPALSKEQREDLKHKESNATTTEDEDLLLESDNVRSLYAIPDEEQPPTELIDQHVKNRRFYAQTRLLYYFTVGQEFMANRERNKLNNFIEQSMGKVFSPDIGRVMISQKIMMMQLLDFNRFLDPDREFSNESEKAWYENLVQYRWQVREILGVLPTEKDTPMSFIQKALKRLFNHTLTLDRRENKEGERTRIYKGIDINSDALIKGIFDRWFERDRASSAYDELVAFEQSMREAA